MTEADTLLVGHATRDVAPPRDRLGGCVAYAGHAHRALGATVEVCTSFGSDLPEAHRLEGFRVNTSPRPSPCSTAFENEYPAGGPRRQRLLARAAPLCAKDFPEVHGRRWRVLHLCPVMGELDVADWLDSVEGSLVGVGLQGLMRDAGSAAGVVTTRRIEPAHWWSRVDWVFLSDEDLIGQEPVLAELRRRIPRVVLTHGQAGATLFRAPRETLHVPAAPATVVDPTGAGDVFAGATLQASARGMPPERTLTLAAALAARAITRRGVADLTVPDSRQFHQGAIAARFHQSL